MTSDLYDDWGQRVRLKRVAARMLQSDLGEKAGCSGAQVSNIERGLTSPSDALRMRLAAALDTTVDELFPYPAPAAAAAAEPELFPYPAPAAAAAEPAA